MAQLVTMISHPRRSRRGGAAARADQGNFATVRSSKINRVNVLERSICASTWRRGYAPWVVAACPLWSDSVRGVSLRAARAPSVRWTEGSGARFRARYGPIAGNAGRRGGSLRSGHHHGRDGASRQTFSRVNCPVGRGQGVAGTCVPVTVVISQQHGMGVASCSGWAVDRV